jgi:hypothetical protein
MMQDIDWKLIDSILFEAGEGNQDVDAEISDDELEAMSGLADDLEDAPASDVPATELAKIQSEPDETLDIQDEEPFNYALKYYNENVIPVASNESAVKAAVDKYMSDPDLTEIYKLYFKAIMGAGAVPGKTKTGDRIVRQLPIEDALTKRVMDKTTKKVITEKDKKDWESEAVAVVRKYYSRQAELARNALTEFVKAANPIIKAAAEKEVGLTGADLDALITDTRNQLVELGKKYTVGNQNLVDLLGGAENFADQTMSEIPESDIQEGGGRFLRLYNKLVSNVVAKDRFGIAIDNIPNADKKVFMRQQFESLPFLSGKGRKIDRLLTNVADSEIKIADKLKQKAVETGTPVTAKDFSRVVNDTWAQRLEFRDEKTKNLFTKVLGSSHPTGEIDVDLKRQFEDAKSKALQNKDGDYFSNLSKEIATIIRDNGYGQYSAGLLKKMVESERKSDTPVIADLKSKISALVKGTDASDPLAVAKKGGEIKKKILSSDPDFSRLSTADKHKLMSEINSSIRQTIETAKTNMTEQNFGDLLSVDAFTDFVNLEDEALATTGPSYEALGTDLNRRVEELYANDPDISTNPRYRKTMDTMLAQYDVGYKVSRDRALERMAGIESRVKNDILKNKIEDQTRAATQKSVDNFNAVKRVIVENPRGFYGDPAKVTDLLTSSTNKLDQSIKNSVEFDALVSDYLDDVDGTSNKIIDFVKSKLSEGTSPTGLNGTEATSVLKNMEDSMQTSGSITEDDIKKYRDLIGRPVSKFFGTAYPITVISDAVSKFKELEKNALEKSTADFTPANIYNQIIASAAGISDPGEKDIVEKLASAYSGDNYSPEEGVATVKNLEKQLDAAVPFAIRKQYEKLKELRPDRKKGDPMTAADVEDESLIRELAFKHEDKLVKKPGYTGNISAARKTIMQDRITKLMDFVETELNKSQNPEEDLQKYIDSIKESVASMREEKKLDEDVKVEQDKVREKQRQAEADGIEYVPTVEETQVMAYTTSPNYEIVDMYGNHIPEQLAYEFIRELVKSEQVKTNAPVEKFVQSADPRTEIRVYAKDIADKIKLARVSGSDSISDLYGSELDIEKAKNIYTEIRDSYEKIQSEVVNSISTAIYNSAMETMLDAPDHYGEPQRVINFLSDFFRNDGKDYPQYIQKWVLDKFRNHPRLGSITPTALTSYAIPLVQEKFAEFTGEIPGFRTREEESAKSRESFDTAKQKETKKVETELADFYNRLEKGGVGGRGAAGDIEEKKVETVISRMEKNLEKAHPGLMSNLDADRKNAVHAAWTEIARLKKTQEYWSTRNEMGLASTKEMRDQIAGLEALIEKQERIANTALGIVEEPEAPVVAPVKSLEKAPVKQVEAPAPAPASTEAIPTQNLGEATAGLIKKLKTLFVNRVPLSGVKTELQKFTEEHPEIADKITSATPALLMGMKKGGGAWIKEFAEAIK